MSIAIETSQLQKLFGQKAAVHSFNLRVPQGSMFGIVGPNGAGKTTALSMITGLLKPTAGEISVLGHSVWPDPTAVKALIGVLPDGIRTFDRLTGAELIRYTGQLRGLPLTEIQARGDSLLTLLGLTEARNKLITDYSAGMKKKIQLAAALIHNPKLIILDEPFEAVDPVSSETIRGILHQVVARGGTVVLSSHVMELVEKLCDSVAIVHQGTIIAQGSVAEVSGGSSLQNRFVELVGGAAQVGDELSWLG